MPRYQDWDPAIWHMKWVTWPGYPAARVAKAFAWAGWPPSPQPFAELDWLRATEAILGGFAFSHGHRWFPVWDDLQDTLARSGFPIGSTDREGPALLSKCFMQAAWATLTERSGQKSRPGEAGLSDSQLALVARRFAAPPLGEWGGTNAYIGTTVHAFFTLLLVHGRVDLLRCAWRTCLEFGDPATHAGLQVWEADQFHLAAVAPKAPPPLALASV